MLKFLRKYQMLLLVVGGSMLMIAFLAPQAIQRLGQIRPGSTYMTVKGEKISRQEMQETQLAVTTTRGIMAQMTRGAVVPERDQAVVLVEEAKRRGFVGGPSEGASYVSIMAQRQGVSEAQVRSQLAGRGASENPLAVDDGIAAGLGVGRMFMTYLSGPVMGVDREISAARELGDKAEVQYVFVDGSELVEGMDEPSEEELAEHFARFENVKPSEGEYGIGYLLPARVKLRWLEIDRDMLATWARVDRLEAIDAYASQKAEDAPAWTELDQGQKDRFIAQQKEKEADKLMEEALQVVRSEVARLRSGMDSDGEYLLLPEGWNADDVGLEGIAEKVTERLSKLTGGGIVNVPVRVREDGWLTQQDLITLPGIGSAFAQRGQDRLWFFQLAPMVREIAGPNQWQLQVGFPGETVQDRTGNRYVFVISQAKDESPAESMETVRDRVVRDYKRLKAYEQLEGQVEQMQQVAIDEGLGAAAEAFGVIGEGMGSAAVRRATVTRQQVLGGQGAHAQVNVEAFREAVMEAAGQMDPTINPELIDVSERVVVEPVDKSLGVAVVLINAFKPMTLDEARQALTQGTYGQQQRMLEMFEADALDAFEMDTLVERMDVKFKEKNEDGQE